MKSETCSIFRNCRKKFACPRPFSFFSIIIISIMPKVSFKQKYLYGMEESIALMVMLQIVGEYIRMRRKKLSREATKSLCARRILLHPTIKGCFELFGSTSQNRYLLPRGRRLRPVDKFAIDLNISPGSDTSEVPPWLNDAEFVNAYRMSRRAFYQLLHNIEDHEVFKQGTRGPPQAPVAEQLMTLCIT